MGNREDVIRKVRSLLEKEQSSGCTPEEVAAAIAKATRLLEREGLTRAALEIEQQVTEEEIKIANDPLWQAKERRSQWRMDLALVLTDHFGCFYFTRASSIMICGKPSNIDTVRYLFAYCEKEIDRLTKENCAGEGKTYSNNFRIGCTEAIDSAIRNEKASERDAQRKNATGNSTALVLVNNAIARLDNEKADSANFAYSKLNFGAAKPMPMTSNDLARMHGRSAGANIYPGAGKGKAIGSNNKQLKG